MPIKDFIIKRQDLYRVDPDTLIEDKGWNVRLPGPELDAHIRWLADSIKEQGVKQPLTCYMADDGLHTTDGHCRLLAVAIAKKEGAEIKTVPVTLEERYSKAEDRVLSMVTRNSGKNLTQLELGEVFKRLLGYGWTINDIAQKVSYTVGHVGNILTLAGASSDVTDLVKNGKVSATLAVDTLREEGDKAGEVLQQAINGAEVEGKKKATKKDVKKTKTGDNSGAAKKIPWARLGPLLRKASQDLYDNLWDDFEENTDPATQANLITLGNVLGDMDEAYGEVKVEESGQEQLQLPV